MTTASSSTLVVGQVSDDSAVLTAQQGGADGSFHVVRLPLSLLPPGVAVGQVIELTARRSVEAESDREREILSIQHELRQRLGPMPSVVAGTNDPLAS